MPEGDTVWLAAHRMHEAFAGQVLTRTDFRVPQLATTDLAGRSVTEVVARGKHMLTRLTGDLTLHTHFLMDGTWRLFSPGAPWGGGPDWQVRVVLHSERTVAVGYRMPVIELLRTADEASVVGHLGPDTLGEDWDESVATDNLVADPDRTVGEALLDQRVLAGVGNLYKAETCFLRGLSPWTPVGAVADPGALVRLAQRLLRANRDRVEQATTGDTRRGREHWVFERAGQPCRRCGTRVRSAMQGLAPWERISYWCPSCQPGAAPVPGEAVVPRRPAGRTRYRP